jgi:hypothetical protein
LFSASRVLQSIESLPLLRRLLGIRTEDKKQRLLEQYEFLHINIDLMTTVGECRTWKAISRSFTRTRVLEKVALIFIKYEIDILSMEINDPAENWIAITSAHAQLSYSV